MKHNPLQASELLRDLAVELANFALSLQALSSSLKKENTRAARKLQQITQKILKTKATMERTSELKILTLAGQDYTNFCLLVFYGNFMANYLISLKKVNKDPLRHAQCWKNLIVQCKPFFERKIITQ